MLNYYRKKLIKITAASLAVILVIGLFPVLQVYGSVQPGIHDLQIFDVAGSSNASNTYAVDLMWDLWADNEFIFDSELDVGIAADSTTPAMGILVREKRLVAGVAAKDYVLSTSAPLATRASITLNSATRGSLYSFKVYPYHLHKTVRMVEGQYVDGPPINVYPPESAMEEVLYMTNIKVDALGSVNEANENCLTVTWDNPSYNGASVIPNYKIYFTPVTDGTGINEIRDFEHQLSVNMSETVALADSSDTSIRRLEYTFTSEFLEQGKKYIVAVEPCDTEGNPYRMQSVSRVNVNGRWLQMEYKKIDAILYKSIEVGIPFTLNLDVYSDAYLRLTWPQVEAAGANAIVIYSSTDEKVWTEITRIYNTERTYYLVPRPKTGITFYKIGFFKSDSDIANNVKPEPETSTPYPSYNASGMDITPSRPELKMDLASTSTNTSIVVDATWGAFVRAPLTSVEEQNSTGTTTTGLKYVDTEVYYDIWLTDDLNSLLYSFGSVPKLIDKGQFTLNEEDNTYSVPLDKYYDSTTKNLEKIVSNKLYYARIVARRPSSTPLNDLKERWSDPGYATFYITARGQIATPPMISKPPLQVARDEDGEKIITQTSITFTWREKWIELYDNDSSKSEDDRHWYTSPVGKSNGRIVFGDEAEKTGVTPIDLSIYNDLETLHNDLGADVIARQMDLTGSKYEYKVYTYNDISDRIGTKEDYDEFLKEVVDKEPAGTWTQINSVSEDENGYPVFSITGTPNTTYVVLFRAYRDVPPTGLKVAFPTYIIEATLPIGTDVIIKPTVPKLILVDGSITDTSASVKWESSKLLKYELSYSDVYTDPSKGIKISFDNVTENGEIKTENDIDFTYLPVDGLFPDTVYNIWIRAVTLDGKESSSWSNQLTFKTNDMPVPSPPRGLGAASAPDLEVVNANLGTKYQKTAKDYFIVTWLKNDKDKLDDKAGATAEPNTARIEDESLTDVFLAQFSALLPNKEYYIRAKTIATVTPIDGGKANKTYSYVVQVSVTPEFEEYVQITVPETVPNPDKDGSTKYYKQKESGWTVTIRIKTNTTSDEYDGEADDAFYPLQNEDFEIIYDSASNTVTLRFRVDGVDSAGNHDNRLDQRFISRLATNKIYTYNLDLSQNNFNTKVVELPYSIIKALDERKIDLKFKPTNDTLLTIPYGAIAGSAVKSMQGLSDTTKISITVTNNSAAPTLDANENYVVYPYKVAVKVVSPKQTINLTDTVKPMTLEMKSPTAQSSTGVYLSSSANDEWKPLNSTYDAKGAWLKANSSKLGLYSIITDSAAGQMPTIINTGGSVTGNVYNNVVLSVLENKTPTDINAAVSPIDLQKLVKAGLSVSADGDTDVSREEAIAALVTLYEKKSGSRIKYYDTIDESPYVDIADASPSYQTALLKAAEIGFFSDGAFTTPNAPLAYRDLIYMIDVINNNSK